MILLNFLLSCLLFMTLFNGLWFTTYWMFAIFFNYLILFSYLFTTLFLFNYICYLLPCSVTCFLFLRACAATVFACIASLSIGLANSLDESFHVMQHITDYSSSSYFNHRAFICSNNLTSLQTISIIIYLFNSLFKHS